MTTDDLAELLAEHGDYYVENDRWGPVQWFCKCGHKLPDDDLDAALAAHQAAVIAAAGWVRLEDLIEWFETEDPETLNGDDREFETVAVYLRAFKDCEPAE